MADRVNDKMLASQLTVLAGRLNLPIARGEFIAGKYHQHAGLQISSRGGNRWALAWVHGPGTSESDIGYSSSKRELYDNLYFASQLLYGHYLRDSAYSSAFLHGGGARKNPPRFSPRAPSKKNLATFTDKELSHMIRVTKGAVKNKYLAEAGRRVAGEYTKRYGKNPRRHSSPRPELFKPPYNVQIDSERDNLGIWLSDRDDKMIAHWHDDEAREMIEDGFFEGSGKKLADSVVEYARSVGMIR